MPLTAVPGNTANGPVLLTRMISRRIPASAWSGPGGSALARVHHQDHTALALARLGILLEASGTGYRATLWPRAGQAVATRPIVGVERRTMARLQAVATRPIVGLCQRADHGIIGRISHRVPLLTA